MQVYLDTERLALRRLTVDDVDNLVALDGDPAVMRYLSGGPPTPRDIIERDILPRFLSDYECFPGFGVWAAIEKSTGDFLGWLSLRPSDGDRVAEATLGYRLHKSAWGQGYATEGSRALICKGFAELGVRRVVATTYQDNLASRRVMEKLGMTHVRSYRLTPTDLAAHPTFDVPSQDAWEGWEGDDVEYVLSKTDWERLSPDVRGC
jgi:RimJ/RimL family protein N-acetyltransferase